MATPRVKKLGFLSITVVVLTAWIGWLAAAPDPYLVRYEESFDEPYPWLYPVWTLVVGVGAVLFLSPLRPIWSFFGAVAAFGLTAASFVALVFSIMHSHPVHESLLMVMLFASGALLFLAGYRFALWRKAEDAAPLD